MLGPTTKSVVPSNTWEWAHAHASRRSEQIQKQILRDCETQTYCRYTLLLASLALVGSSVLRWQTVRLFLTIDLSSLLCKVWFHSGKYEMGPGEGSRLGQGGTPYSRASYLRVTLGILPWHSFQPLRCLKPPPWVFATSLPMIGAFQLGTAPGWSPPPPPPPILFDWRKEKAEKCSKGLWPRKAQCERWWWRRGCDAYLPLTHTAVIAQHFTIWRSIQQPGEDVSLTRHLDRTDKHWGWTDLPLTLSMNIPFSYGQITPWFAVTP